MSQNIEVHLHIHGGASPAAVEAAVRAALVGREDGNVSLAGATAPDADDAARVRRYWERAYTESQTDEYGRARALLAFLAQRPDRLVPYPEVTRALGLSSARSLPGLLGAFSRRAKHRYRDVQPFERRWADGQWNLWMSTEAADVIRRLL
jgi:hypothetical protein